MNPSVHRFVWIAGLSILAWLPSGCVESLRATRSLAAQTRSAESDSCLEVLTPEASCAHSSLPFGIRRLLRYEQEYMVLDGGDPTKMHRDTNRQADAYKPQAMTEFTLKSYWVSSTVFRGMEGAHLSAKMRAQFVREKNGQTQYRLIVHPESENFYRKFLKKGQAEPAEDYRGTATSSARTLVVWIPGHEEDAFFAKLSLNRKVAETNRVLGRTEVAGSVGTERIVAASEPELPQGTFILHDSFGLAPEGQDKGGMLIREIPREISSGKRNFMPVFSLYATPPGGGPPLLARMIRMSGMSAGDFVRERIIRPFVRKWLQFEIIQGITMIPHGQNILVEIGEDGMPTGGFLFRDFGDFRVDLAYRKQAGKPVPADLPHFYSIDRDYVQSDLAETFERNFPTYFCGSILYDLDERLPEWQKAGWIPGPVPPASQAELQGVGLDVVAEEYTALTGIPLKLDRRWENYAGKIASARKKLGLLRSK